MCLYTYDVINQRHLVGADDAHAGSNEAVRLQDRQHLCVLPFDVPLELLRGWHMMASRDRTTSTQSLIPPLTSMPETV